LETKQETVGTSPKAIAASLAALIAPIVAGVVLNALGVEVDVDTVAAILGPLFLGIITFIAARLASPGKVVEVPVDTPAGPEAGYVDATLLIAVSALVLAVLAIAGVTID
jgi:hypothetical protein